MFRAKMECLFLFGVGALEGILKQAEFIFQQKDSPDRFVDQRKIDLSFFDQLARVV